MGRALPPQMCVPKCILYPRINRVLGFKPILTKAKQALSPKKSQRSIRPALVFIPSGRHKSGLVCPSVIKNQLSWPQHTMSPEPKRRSYVPQRARKATSPPHPRAGVGLSWVSGPIIHPAHPSHVLHNPSLRGFGRCLRKELTHK